MDDIRFLIVVTLPLSELSMPASTPKVTLHKSFNKESGDNLVACKITLE